jgi:RNA polymerase sigma factor (sigma-70 family)
MSPLLMDPNAPTEVITPGGGRRGFVTTHWSTVLAAGRSDSPRAQAAMAELCQAYWYPLYAFARRQGQSVEDAEDIIQGFFCRLLEKDFLHDVAPEKGRFRSFLLACLKHYLADERDRQQAQKRGGGREIVSFDSATAEARYRLEPVDGPTPESLYDREWALAILDRVFNRLRDEQEEKREAFDRLKSFLIGEKGDDSYAQAAEYLGWTLSKVKVTIHRLRQRYRELLNQEIAETVASPDEIEGEMEQLMAALRN